MVIGGDRTFRRCALIEIGHWRCVIGQKPSLLSSHMRGAVWLCCTLPTMVCPKIKVPSNHGVNLLKSQSKTDTSSSDTLTESCSPQAPLGQNLSQRVRVWILLPSKGGRMAGW